MNYFLWSIWENAVIKVLNAMRLRFYDLWTEWRGTNESSESFFRAASSKKHYEFASGLLLQPVLIKLSGKNLFVFGLCSRTWYAFSAVLSLSSNEEPRLVGLHTGKNSFDKRCFLRQVNCVIFWLNLLNLRRTYKNFNFNSENIMRNMVDKVLWLFKIAKSGLCIERVECYSRVRKANCI